MMSTISEVPCPMGSQRLGMASSDTVIMTALPASRTGMPAATSAPKTTSSSTSVIGPEVKPACRKS